MADQTKLHKRGPAPSPAIDRPPEAKPVKPPDLIPDPLPSVIGPPVTVPEVATAREKGTVRPPQAETRFVAPCLIPDGERATPGLKRFKLRTTHQGVRMRYALAATAEEAERVYREVNGIPSGAEVVSFSLPD